MTDYRDYDPFDPAVTTDPYPYYAALRRQSPVHHVAQYDLWAVSRHHDVMTVLHDAATFTNQAMAEVVVRPGDYERAGDVNDDEPTAVSIIGTDGDEHARLRRIVSRGFTPKRIADLEPSIRRITRGLIDDFIDRGRCELIADLAAPMPVAVIAELLGVDADRHDDFRRWSEAMILAVFEPTTPEQAAHISSCLDEMGAWMAEASEQRMRQPADDLISVLVRAEADEALSHNEMQTFAFTLMVAASVTTTHLLGNAMLALVENPSVLGAVVVDHDVIPSVLEESLRYDSPAQTMLRSAARDVVLSETTIPAGATVVALLGSANRDGTVFRDPDQFDPRRDAREHLAFGHGAHFCLGASLARLEARIALEELFARMRDPVVVAETPRVHSFIFRGPQRLDLEFAPTQAHAGSTRG